jgi:hypothetical protein
MDLGKILKSGKRQVITGDFNFHIDENNTPTKYLEEKEFVQLDTSAQSRFSNLSRQREGGGS